MGLSHKHKTIFIHIPKAAGTSINKALNPICGGHHRWKWYKREYPNEWEVYFKFAVIREPLERFISNYNYARMEKSYWHSSDGNAKAGKHPDYDLLKNASLSKCVENLLLGKLKYVGWKQQHRFVNNDVFLYDLKSINAEFEKNFNVKLDTLNTSEGAEKLNIPAPVKSEIYDYYKKDFKLWKSLQ